MFAGIFQAWSEEFWWDNKSSGGGGGGDGWATNTLFVLLLILICQLSAKARLWLGLLFKSSSSLSVANSPFRSVAVVSPNDSKFKNTSVLPSIHPQLRLSEIISDLDLKSLIDNLDEKSHEYQNWDNVIDRSNGLLSYSAKCCKLKDGPLKYLSVSIFENCSPEMLRDFYMDNNYRKMWDKTLIEYRELQFDESNGTEIGCIIKKFPLLTAREYILAWRVWEAKDGTFYCFSKECEHPLVPRQKKYVRVEFFRSSWRIRKVPGRNACEIRLVHQEDAGLNVKMAKLAFSKGIWSYVCKMDNALRKYPAICPQSSLGVTSVTLIQQVPADLDTTMDVSDPAHPETSATNASCCQSAPEGSGRKLSRRPLNKLITKGIFLLGGLICMSCGRSKLGTKVAIAYIFTKLTNRGSSINQSRQA